MSTFAVRVWRITDPVEHHPNADRLSLVRVGGYVCISAKLEDGSHRYQQGDLVCYIPEAAVLPEAILRRLDLWDETAGKGRCAGSKGDRIKALKLRGIFSQGMLMEVRGLHDDARLGVPSGYITDLVGDSVKVVEGDDAAVHLGITKYEPPIPVHMAGEIANRFGYTVPYDFENLQSVPDLFEDGEEVVASEKLHGTFCAITYHPDADPTELWGSGELATSHVGERGAIFTYSKGLGSQGLVLKNNEANKDNLYVRNLNRLMAADTPISSLLTWLSAMGDGETLRPVTIFGEIFGKGVQDLAYGTTEPQFRVFDVKIGNDFIAHGSADFERLRLMLSVHKIETVPLLYVGPFDKAKLEGYRDGKDTISGTNVREGIVIRSAKEVRHPYHGRKIAKMVSPDYLLRKGAGEEVQ